MLDKKGFLSNDMSSWKDKHKNDNKILFKLCGALNEFSHDTMLSLQVTNNNLQELLSACSYVRVMSNFQSIIILAEYGLINEAKIILRTMVEAMFLMVAIAKDKDFSFAIVEQDILERQRTLKTIKRNIINGIHKLDKPTLEEIDKNLSTLQTEIKDKKIKQMYKSDLAKTADLSSYYDTIYHVLSGSVHINPRDLEQYLEINSEGMVKEIKWGPDVEEIDDILFSAIEIIIFALESVAHVFNLTFDDNWKSLHKEYQALGEKAIN